MALRKTTSTSDPSRALSAALSGSAAELPRGAAGVLERVFWRRASSSREARVVPLPAIVRAPDRGTKQEA